MRECQGKLGTGTIENRSAYYFAALIDLAEGADQREVTSSTPGVPEPSRRAVFGSKA